MSNLPYFKFYIGDVLRDTADLGPQEAGAYFRLMIRQWERGPLPDDDAVLAKIAKVRPDVWRRIAPDIRQVFQPAGDSLIALPWMEKQRGNLTKTSDERAQAGAQGGRAKALKNKGAGLANAKQMPGDCQPVASIVRSQKEGLRPSAADAASGGGGIPP